MDKLQKVAKYYSQNLEGKKFHLVAGKNKRLMELDIVFSASNFKHLVGLHKLKDLPIYRRPSAILYRQILEGKTTFDDISKSAYLSEMEDRLGAFNQIKDTLFASNLMLKSLNGEFKKIEADFLLAKKSESDGYVHLFLKNEKDGITVPVTFFERNGDEYLRIHSGRWTVLSVEEVKEEVSTKTQTQQRQPQQVQQEEKPQSDKSTVEQPKNDLPKIDDGKLDLVACTMEQCRAKLDAEIALAKRTQKETASQQVSQVGQSRQVEQVGLVRQVGQVKQKTKSNNGTSGKR